MAQIDLRQRLLQPGLSGSVDLDPLRKAFDAAAERSTALLAASLGELGWGVQEIAATVDALREQMAVGLDLQANYLQAQLGALQSIDAALRSPAKVRAAERMSDAAGLLRTGRYERALQCANEAIDSDPNHPGGLLAAGLALVGLGRIDEALKNFDEARVAASEYGPWLESTRQTARCLTVLGETCRAEVLLDDALTRVEKAAGADSRRLIDVGTLHYDSALVAVAGEDSDRASSHVRSAVTVDTRFAQAALAEPLFEDYPQIVSAALDQAKTVEQSRKSGSRIDTGDDVRAFARNVAKDYFASRPAPPPPQAAPPPPQRKGLFRRAARSVPVAPPAPPPPPVVQLWCQKHWRRSEGMPPQIEERETTLNLSESGEILCGAITTEYSGGWSEPRIYHGQPATDEELRYADYEWENKYGGMSASWGPKDTTSLQPYEGITRLLRHLQKRQ